MLLSTFCCTFAALGSFLFGYDIGIIASAIEQPDFNRRFGHGKLSDDLAGGIVSSFTGGAILGTLVVSQLSDRYGRRTAIFIGALFACLGGSLQGGANVAATVIIGRVFTGVGIGLLSPTIPNFCMEIAPPKVRGMLGGLQQWMLGLGIVTAQWTGYGCSLVGGPFSWRFSLGIQVAPALLLASGVYCLPESPRHLAERGDMAKARHALERLHLQKDRSNQEFVNNEMKEITTSIQAERESAETMTWASLMKSRPLRKRLLLACGIQLFTQTSGVNVIGYYGPRIYTALGYSATTSLFIQGLYGALAQLWNTVCIAFVDKVGRRKLLIPSMIGMGAALCVEATLVRYFDPATTENVAALRASVAMNFVFSVFFTSLGVLSWIYSGEIFPTGLRAKGTSLSTLTNWASNLIFAQCSPLALSKMGYRYFYVFTAFNWVAAVLIFLYYPETQGKQTLESVHQVFGDFSADDSASSLDERGKSTAKEVVVEDV